MKRTIAILLTIIITVSICVINVDAGASKMEQYIDAYKQGDFVKANDIAFELPVNAKSNNSNMSEGMKNAYLEKIISTDKVDSYYLADITGDKKPELFIKTGLYISDQFYYVFKYSKGKVDKIGKFRGGHCYLADYPGKKAVLSAYEFLGYYNLTLVEYENGKVKSTLLNSCDSDKTPCPIVPYLFKTYSCGSYKNYDLSPFSIKNTKAVKAAKKRINKLVKRINPAIFRLYPKTKKIKLSAKNKTILATLAVDQNNYRAHIGNGDHTKYSLVYMKKSYIKSEYNNLFGGKPAYNRLSKKYKKNTKNSIGNLVVRIKKHIGCNSELWKSDDFNNDITYKTAKVECIRKIKGGYRVAVAHYMTKYYESYDSSDETFAHTFIDVKRYNKSKYKYVIKKINSVIYCSKP